MHLNAILPSLILQKPMFFSSLVVNYIWSVSYKSALAQSTCQQRNNHESIHPSASVESEPCADATADLQHPQGECRVESEALCAPGKLNRSSDRYFQELIS